jgi:dTMP kinase
MKRSDTGLLIAFEGIDGAGKTTQVDLLTQFFVSANEPVLRSKEPTDGPWGQRIRASAKSVRLSLQEELNAFIEDRKEHLRDKILPALSNGQVVILDRYFYSTIAYQGSRGGEIEAITAQMLESAPEPDIVFLIDVTPEIGLARIRQGRGEVPNAFETLANLQAVRTVFLDLAKSRANIALIDGTPNAEAVHRVVLATLQDRVLNRKIDALASRERKRQE